MAGPAPTSRRPDGVPLPAHPGTTVAGKSDRPRRNGRGPPTNGPPGMWQTASQSDHAVGVGLIDLASQGSGSLEEPGRPPPCASPSVAASRRLHGRWQPCGNDRRRPPGECTRNLTPLFSRANLSERTRRASFSRWLTDGEDAPSPFARHTLWDSVNKVDVERLQIGVQPGVLDRHQMGRAARLIVMRVPQTRRRHER